MGPHVQSLSSNISNVRQDVFPLDKWTITTRKGTIMQSKCTCKSVEQTARAQLEQISLEPPQAENDLDKEPIELCDICRYKKFLPHLHSMPDMLFNNNLFRLEHMSGVGIEFNPLDALKKVEETQDPLRVAVADGWQSARACCPFAKSVSRPFDWTFTTDYRGTILSAVKKTIKPCHKSKTFTPKQESIPTRRSQQSIVDALKQQDAIEARPSSASSQSDPMIDIHHTDDDTRTSEEDRLTIRVEETDERIDVNKLKQREEILFYDDVTLYEDELADHGTAQYSVKVRVMPNSMFVLARYYLRIDGVLARINDTRVYHELHKRYALREYTNREAKLEGMELPTSTVTNPNELMNHLPLIHCRYEKLILPEIS